MKTSMSVVNAKKSSVEYLEIDFTGEGQRLDNFLCRHFKRVPKTRVYRAIRQGEVRINGKRAAASDKLLIGDRLRLPPLQQASQERRVKPLPFPVEKHILFEDARLLIVDKPSGIAVHGGSGIRLGMIESLRLSRPTARYLELVHRLDRDTSGCLMIAKKPSVLKQLHEMFRNHSIQKVYWAFIKPGVNWESQTICLPLEKNQLRSGERMVTVSRQGKWSETHVRVLHRGNRGTLVEVLPKTGRTHQIRVHLAHQGYSIAGDEKYGEKAFNQAMRRIGLKRLFLHAHALAFQFPEDHQVIQVESSLPPELQKILEN